MVPGNIHTTPHGKSLEIPRWGGGGGSQKPNVLKESMKLNWNFLGWEGRGYRYFLEEHYLSQKTWHSKTMPKASDVMVIMIILMCMSCSSLQSNLIDQGMSNEDSQNIIDKVTKLSGDLHHSVMMAKQFLKEVHVTQITSSLSCKFGQPHTHTQLTLTG